MAPLLVVLLLLLSSVIAEEKRGIFDEYLENFDIECLNSILSDERAVQALQDIQHLNLQNPNIDPDVLIDVEALELSDHLVCSTQTSALCGQVNVLPPRDQSQQLAELIASEFEAKTDDEILAAFKYDINALCASLAEVDQALQPHMTCINQNLEALAGLPAAIRDAILELLEESTGGSASPLHFNLSAVLELSDDCESFKEALVSDIRSQMTADFWNTILLTALNQYDLEAFNTRVMDEINADSKTFYGCTVPSELICTKNRALFYSSCQLNEQHDFDFTLLVPLDGDVEEGSSYMDSFQSFSDLNSGIYPCFDTFRDPCFGQYLDQYPSIPDLMLEMTCRMPGYFYSLTGESPPPSNGGGDGDMGGGDGDMGGGDGDMGGGDGDDNGGDEGSNPGEDDGGEKENSSQGLTAGGVAAVSISAVALISSAGLVGFLYLQRKKANAARQYQVQLE